MTDEELRTLVASLATSTASNAAEARANTEAIRESRIAAESRYEALDRQTRANAEAIRELNTGLASLQASAESQARSIEFMRENMTHNTETVASSLELAAASQRTAAAAMELSAQTSRNLDRLENDIADLQQMMGIVIRDNQADRGRITRLEEQD